MKEAPLVRITPPHFLEEMSEIPVVRISPFQKETAKVPCVAVTEEGKKMCAVEKKDDFFESSLPSPHIPEASAPSFSPRVSKEVFSENAAEQGVILSQEWGVFRPSVAKTSFDGVQTSAEMTQMLSNMSGARSGVFMASHIAEVPAHTEDLFVQRMLLLQEMKHVSELQLAQEVQNAHDRFSRFEELSSGLDDVLFRSQQELTALSGEQEALKHEIAALKGDKKAANEAFFADFSALSTESIDEHFSQILSSKKGLTEQETYFSRNEILQKNMTKLHSYIAGRKVLLQQNREALLLGMPISSSSSGVLDFIQ